MVHSATPVNIQATPTSNHIFLSWTGTGTGSYTGTNNPATVTMNGQITETANFQQTASQLSVTLVSPKNGRLLVHLQFLRVTVAGNVSGFVQGATVTVFLDGNQICSGYTNPEGSSSRYPAPNTRGTHSSYAAAAKNGFTSGTSPTWTLTYEAANQSKSWLHG